jgi:hypothetical protein
MFAWASISRLASENVVGRYNPGSDDRNVAPALRGSRRAPDGAHHVLDGVRGGGGPRMCGQAPETTVPGCQTRPSNWFDH